MANGSQRVTPGDLITSELWNGFVDSLDDAITRLDALEGTVSTGNQIVPDLFGATLAEARQVIAQPQVRLRLGNVIDAFGNIVNPLASGNGTRLIVGQTPPAQFRAPAESRVHLLVAALPAGGSTTPGGGAPRIDFFTPVEVPIGGFVTIVGDNFVGTTAQIQVSFDGNSTNPEPGHSRVSLIVRVPPQLAAPAPAESRTVAVVLTTPGGSATSELTVLPPLGGEVPNLTEVQAPDGVASIGGNITLVGSGFSSTPSTNIVTFINAGTPANTTPNSVSADRTQLVVTVPPISGISPGDVVTVTVRISVGPQQSNALSVDVFNPPQI